MKLRTVGVFVLALAFVTGLMVLLAPRAQASGWWRCVNPGGTNGCYSNIQAAINDSSFGDNINVWAGTYVEHIVLKDGVSIYGAGWDTTTGTVINGNFSTNYSTILVPSTVGPTTILSGVQVTGGGSGNPGTSTDGGGIWIGGSPIISNTWVNHNTGYFGGGLTVWGGSPTLSNVPAWSNQGVVGGGFYFGNSAVVTLTSDALGTDGTVLWNSANNSGGGIYVNNASVSLSGLQVWWNTAPQGGGIYTTLAPNLQIQDNTFNWNSSRSAGGGVYLDRSAGRLSNNGLFGNVVTDTGSLGGGAFVTGSSSGVTFDRDWFESNSAVLAGGGLDLESGAVALINANTIVSNTARGGAGVSMSAAGTVTFTNNIVARNVTQITYPSGLSIYATAARITNNTIADNTWLGIYFHTSNGIVIANNLIAGNGMGIYRAEGTTSIFTADYNDIYNNNPGGNYYNVPPGAHDLSLDPGFIGVGDMRANYHLQSTSPVYNTGSLAYAPPFDIDGEARVLCASMGADQIGCRRLDLPLILR